MPPRRVTFNFTRLATVAYLGAVCLAVVQLAVALNDEKQRLAGVAAALAYLLAGFLVAGLLNAIAASVSRIDDLSRQMSETAADQTSAARQFAARIDELLETARRAGHQPLPEAPEPPPPPVEPSTPEPPAAEPALAEPPADSVAGDGESEAPPPAVEPAIDQHIVHLLEEIRELALMNDQQRQQRLQQHLEKRKRTQLDELFQHIKTQQWARAESIMLTLESQFPDDPSVREARGELVHARDAAEPAALKEVHQRIEDLVSINSWEKALAAAAQFVEDFPTSTSGREMLTRLQDDYTIHRESLFQRLYDEVQAHVDRREWRDALDASHRLLDTYPAHARSGRIRQQLAIISENAEIEERQEQEIRIQQLVRGRRFAEAVELAEEVLRKYPDSPQAMAIDRMLPRLRDLAEHGDEDGSAELTAT